MLINQIVMTGNVVRSPELSNTVKGHPFTRFRFACNRPPRNPEAEGEADFVDVEAYGRLAENLCSTCSVGDRLLVVGKMRHQRWEDDEGNKRARYVVLADAVGVSMEFKALGQRAEESGEGPVDACEN
jgi:single-strand DNA-binding protein